MISNNIFITNTILRYMCTHVYVYPVEPDESCKDPISYGRILPFSL